MAGKRGSEFKKPKSGEFILRDGWTMPTEPCKRGHLVPRVKNGTCAQCLRDYRKSRGHFTASTSNVEWRKKNRELLNVQRQEYNAKNAERTMLNAAKRSAKNAGVPFALEISDIVIPEYCPALGLKLIRTRGYRSDVSPSIDRIIPKKGYVRENIMIVSMRANRIKNNATFEELTKMANFYGSLKLKD